MKLPIVTFFLLFSFQYISAKKIVDFSKEESALISAYQKISRNNSEVENLQFTSDFITLFDSILTNPETFEYPFANLPFANVVAPDNSFRIYSWFLLHESGTYENFGFVQLNPEGKRKYSVFRLEDARENMRNPHAVVCSPNKWYGACYYAIIPVKKDGETLYTLLGWNPNTLLTQQKVIDVIRFKNNIPEFGFPILEMRGKGTQRRIIFEYSAKSTMMLKFEPKKRMIVFDHLAPSAPQYEDIYEYYGPDGSIDGYKYKKNRWRFQNVVDARNSRSSFKEYLPQFLQSLLFKERDISR